jgi:hypothetical protein
MPEAEVSIVNTSRLGQLQSRELFVGILDRHLRGIADRHRVATARMCRSVLSGMCAPTARHAALPRNPVKDLGRITGRPKTAPLADTERHSSKGVQTAGP